MTRTTSVLLVSLALLASPSSAQADKDEGSAEPAALPQTDGGLGERERDSSATARSPSPPRTPAPSKAKIKPLIEGAARQYGVESQLLHAVVAVESAYNAHAISRAGAIGLMQVMPATAADYGVTDPGELFDPAINIRTGTRHLKRLLRKYKSDYGRVIMVYNAGEGVVDRTNSNVTYAETLDYTEAVIHRYRRNGGTQPTDSALKKVAMLRTISTNPKGRRLLSKYLDPSLLSLRGRRSAGVRYIEPSLRRELPNSRPMSVMPSSKKWDGDISSTFRRRH